MATFTQFQDELLVALYDLSERLEAETVLSGDIFSHYLILRKPNWVIRSLIDFEERKLIHENLTHDDESSQSISLTAAGMREAERLLEGGVHVMYVEDLVDLGEENYDVEGQVAPASDRIVFYDDNRPEAQEISKNLADLAEFIRGLNDPEIEVDEKRRVQSALESAKIIWDSRNFKVIQLQVGILMAVEDAISFLGKVSKQSAWEFLIDGIKFFAKQFLHIDLDHL